MKRKAKRLVSDFQSSGPLQMNVHSVIGGVIQLGHDQVARIRDAQNSWRVGGKEESVRDKKG